MKRIYFLFFLSTTYLYSQQPKVGLVLSGGGAKSLAQIGVIKEIERSGLQVDYVAGSSVGALIAALYASGYSGDEIEEVLLKMDFKDLILDIVPRRDIPMFDKKYLNKGKFKIPLEGKKISLKGISSGQNIQNYLTELSSVNDNEENFKDLPIPFFCVVVDLETGERIVLEKGDFVSSVRASFAFPILIQPVIIDNKILGDGGINDNFPITELRNKGMDFVIGVDTQDNLIPKIELTSLVQVLLQNISFMFRKQTNAQIKDLDLYIKPDVKDYNILSFRGGAQLIENGVKEASKHSKLFDSIAKLQKVKRKFKKIKNISPVDKFLIDEISINGNKIFSDEFILKDLNLKIKDSLSYHDISRKIDRLTATKNFTNVRYSLKDNKEGKLLEFNVIENNQRAFIVFDAHYDNLFGFGLLTNYTLKRILNNNDILSVDAIVGKNLRYNINYLMGHSSSDFGLGVGSKYSQFSSNISTDGFTSSMKFSEFRNKLYSQLKLDNAFSLDIGVESRFINYFSNTSLPESQKFVFENVGNLIGFSTLTFDSFDRNNYPTKGFYFKGNVDYVFSPVKGNDKFIQVSTFMSLPHTFFNKFTVQPSIELGYSFLNKPSNEFRYKVGGSNKNPLTSFVNFYGLNVLDKVTDNYIKFDTAVRYNFYGGHHFLADMNFISFDPEINNLDNVNSGYALGYGHNSIIGPLEIRYAWSPQNESAIYINLGFWF